MADKLNTIEEAGASENSLKPGGGTGGGDIKMRTIADIVAQLGTMSDEDLNGFKESIAQIGHEADMVGDVAGKNKASIAAKPSAASMKGVVKEDIARLFAGEDTETPLSESFIDGATNLFEAAINTRLAVEVEAIEEDMNEQLETAVEKSITEMTVRMDTYLDYIAEEFMTANQVAIDAGIKSELSESFIEGMKKVFIDHNVDIPEADVDVILGLNEQIDALTEQLNETKSILIESKNAVIDSETDTVIQSLAEGMTSVDADRFILVAEQIDFDDLADFTAKATEIKQKLFNVSTVSEGSNGLVLEEVGVLTEEQLTETTVAPVLDPRMARYANAITKNIRQV